MSSLHEDEIENIRRNYSFFDEDGNGLIDFTEFEKLLKVIAPRSTTQQAAEGFSIIDENSDGYIDFDEFVNWWSMNWSEF